MANQTSSRENPRTRGKRIAALLAYIIIMCAALTHTARAQSPDGTAENPYQISTATDLNNVRDNKSVHYKLVADIDLAEYLAGASWQPIGTEGTQAAGWNINAFKGTFDGNGHTISGLYINNTDDGKCFQSLFGKVAGATIKNLGVTGVNITSASQFTGAIAGKLEEGAVITGCYSSGTVTSTQTSGEARVGGIVGTASGSSRVENCYSFCDISTGGTVAGGIAGEIEGNSLISYCYATGSITGNGTVGGVLGLNNACVVQNCVAANGSISITSAQTTINRITGAYSGNTWFEKNYVNGDMTITVDGLPFSPNRNGAYGSSKSLDDLKTKEFYTTPTNWCNDTPWDFTNIWTIDEGVSLPDFNDTTPPELSLPVAYRTSDTEALIGFTTGEAGTAYCLVVESATPAPTGEKVKDADNSLGAVAAGANNKTLTLTEAGAKLVFVVVEDLKGNISEPLLISVPAFDPANAGISINGGTPVYNVSEIRTAIIAALILPNANVTVTGALFGVAEKLNISIPGGKKVTWSADFSGSVSELINLSGDGVFEVTGGTVENTGSGAAVYANSLIFQNGGTITSTGGTPIEVGTLAIAITRTATTTTNYIQNATTDLTVLPTEGANAYWDFVGGVSGITYENGANKGFLPVSGVTVREAGIRVNNGALQTTVAGVKAAIEAVLSTAVEATKTTAVATVTGSLTGVSETLDVSYDVAQGREGSFYATILWQAEYSGAPADAPLIILRGLAGNFKIETGGVITRTDNTSSAILGGANAYTANNGTQLYVNGGTVSGGERTLSSLNMVEVNAGLVTSQKCAIYLINPNGITTFTVIKGGRVETTGDTDHAIVSTTQTSIYVQGGEVFAKGGAAVYDGDLNLNYYPRVTGGLLFAYGTARADVIYSNVTNGLNQWGNDRIIVAWNKGAGTTLYDIGTATHLLAAPEATAVWDNVDGKSGITYANGENTGFFEVAGVTVTSTNVPTNIDNIAGAKAIVSESYYDLTGKPASATTKGFVIKRTVYSDGSVIITKSYEL